MKRKYDNHRKEKRKETIRFAIWCAWKASSNLFNASLKFPSKDSWNKSGSVLSHSLCGFVCTSFIVIYTCGRYENFLYDFYEMLRREFFMITSRVTFWVAMASRASTQIATTPRYVPGSQNYDRIYIRFFCFMIVWLSSCDWLRRWLPPIRGS